MQTSRQPHQSFQIKAFKGDKNDNELAKITPFLIELSSYKDVRSVELNYSLFNNSKAHLLKKSRQEKCSSGQLVLGTTLSSPVTSTAATKFLEVEGFCSDIVNNDSESCNVDTLGFEEDVLIEPIIGFLPSLNSTRYRHFKNCSSFALTSESPKNENKNEGDLNERRHYKGSLSANIHTKPLATRTRSFFFFQNKEPAEYDVEAEESSEYAIVAGVTPELKVRSQRDAMWS